MSGMVQPVPQSETVGLRIVWSISRGLPFRQSRCKMPVANRAETALEMPIGPLSPAIIHFNNRPYENASTDNLWHGPLKPISHEMRRGDVNQIASRHMLS